MFLKKTVSQLETYNAFLCNYSWSHLRRYYACSTEETFIQDFLETVIRVHLSIVIVRCGFHRQSTMLGIRWCISSHIYFS